MSLAVAYLAVANLTVTHLAVATLTVVHLAIANVTITYLTVSPPRCRHLHYHLLSPDSPLSLSLISLSPISFSSTLLSMLGWPRARDGTSRTRAWDGIRHFYIAWAHPIHLLRDPGPSHIENGKTRAHPIFSFSFPVPSHPVPVMGPGWDGPGYQSVS